MKLKSYLRDTGMTYAAFARSIGVNSARTVQRYVDGQRIPRPAILLRIVATTGGKVTANDFYGEEIQMTDEQELRLDNGPAFAPLPCDCGTGE